MASGVWGTRSLERVGGGVTRVVRPRISPAPGARAAPGGLPLSSGTNSCSDRQPRRTLTRWDAGASRVIVVLPQDRPRCPEPEQAWLKQSLREE